LSISEEHLGRINCPTFILWERKNNYFQFNSVHRLHKDIKKSTLVGVDKKGHFLQEEQSEFIQQRILSFLQA